MKKTIFGYEQKGLLKFDIDCVDLVLLDYLSQKTFDDTLESCILKNNRYVIIKESTIIEDLPFLDLTERTLYLRILKLSKLNFIERIKYCKEKGKYARTYMRMTTLINKLKFDN